MNRLTLIFPLLLMVSAIHTQVIVEGVNINDDPEIKMCQLIAQGRIFSNKITITIDYGQLIKWGSDKGSSVKGSDGKPKVFNSLMDATNFMLNNGWEYIDAYVVTVESSNVYRYTFKKKD